MPDYPTFTYRNMYFFLMVLFSVIFVISLTTVSNVPNPLALSAVSFLNIFICIFAWIFNIEIYRNYKTYEAQHTAPAEQQEDHDWYLKQEIRLYLCVWIAVLISTAIGLGFQSF